MDDQQTRSSATVASETPPPRPKSDVDGAAAEAEAAAREAPAEGASQEAAGARAPNQTPTPERAGATALEADADPVNAPPAAPAHASPVAAETLGAPGEGGIRVAGGAALAIAAPAIFGPIAALSVAAGDNPLWAAALILAGAAPLALFGLAAALKLFKPGLRGDALAAPAMLLGLAAAWTAWSSGGALSFAAPWALAGFALAGILGGAFWAGLAALAATGVAGFWLLGPDPMVDLVGFAPRAEREAVAAASWAFAAATLIAALWGARSAAIEASAYGRERRERGPERRAFFRPPSRRAAPAPAPRAATARERSDLAQTAGACGLVVGADGAVIRAYGATAAALAFEAADLEGETLAAVAHPDDVDILQDTLDAARALDAAPQGEAGKRDETPADTPPLILRFRSRLGGFRWTEARAAPTTEAPGAVLLTIRARWRSEHAVETSRDAAQSVFLANMNGELRGALKSIVGYTDILKNELFGPLGAERYRDYAGLAHQGAERLEELVDELLDLSEIEAGRLSMARDLIDPVPLVDGALRLARSRAEGAGMALTSEIDPSTPHIRADRRALRRSLVTIALDGVRRSEIGDKLDLTLTAEDGVVRIALTRAERKEAGRLARAASASAGRSGARDENDAASGLDGETCEDGAIAFPDALIRRAKGLDAPRPGGDGAGEDPNASGARLGRLVAEGLVERMGGTLLFIDHPAPTDGGATRPGAHLLAELLLPTEAAAATPTVVAKVGDAAGSEDARSTTPSTGSAAGGSAAGPAALNKAMLKAAAKRRTDAPYSKASTPKPANASAAANNPLFEPLSHELDAGEAEIDAGKNDADVIERPLFDLADDDAGRKRAGRG